MRLLLWPLRFLAGLLGLAFLYLVVALMGALIPVGGSDTSSDKTREILIRSNGIHLEIVLKDGELGPLRDDINPAIPAVWADYWAFGWGERDFFLNTPTWADFDLWTGVNSILWQDDVLLRVQPVGGRPTGPQVRELAVTEEEYDAVVGFIRSSIRWTDDGKIVPVFDAEPQPHGSAYDPSGIFIEARGTYSMFYTCNEWVNDGLKHAGIGGALWSPFPQGVMWQVGNN